jgi:hypothetical protein
METEEAEALAAEGVRPVLAAEGVKVEEVESAVLEEG